MDNGGSLQTSRPIARKRAGDSVPHDLCDHLKAAFDLAQRTATPNELCVEAHNWMPAILPARYMSTWLGEEPAKPDQVEVFVGAVHRGDDGVAGERSCRHRQEQRGEFDERVVVGKT